MAVSVTKQIKDLTLQESLMTFNTNFTTNESINNPVKKELYDGLMKNIMGDVFSLAKPDNVKMVPQFLLVQLLKRDDYSDQNYGVKDPLESALFTLLCNWYSVNKQVPTNESSVEFMECWNFIKHDLLVPSDINKFTRHVYYNHPSLKIVLAPKLVDLYVAISEIKPRLNKQRMIEYKENLLLGDQLDKLMTVDEIKQLKVGDMLDAKDREDNWYVAKVKAVSDAMIGVHFEGWPNTEDESILIKIGRYAKYGVYTNKKPHIPKGSSSTPCDCVTCTEKIGKKKSGLCNCNKPNCPVGKLSMSDLGNNVNVPNELLQLYKALLGGGMSNLDYDGDSMDDKPQEN